MPIMPGINDANTLQGKAPGHAMGNIPVSDGTVNTDLNADMVDGYHASQAASADAHAVVTDSAGRAKVVAPGASTDVALLSTVTGAIAGEVTARDAAIATAIAPVTAATDVNTPSTIAKRDGSGNFKASDPVAQSDVATRAFVENNINMNNIGIKSSVASNALTVAICQKDGSTDFTSAISGVIYFRSATANTGSQTKRSVTGALSLVVPSTATLGHRSGVVEFVYLYAIDNAGSVELAVATEAVFDEGLLWNTTAITTGSTDRATLYSTTARTGVAIRLIGKYTLTETTAGTWAANSSRREVGSFYTSGKIDASAASTALTSGASLTLCSMVVPAGDFDISSGCRFSPTATTSITGLQFSISQTTNTLSSVTSGTVGDDRTGEYQSRIPLLAATVVQGTTFTIPVNGPTYRVHFEVATTLYFVVAASFTASTLSAIAWMQARAVTK